MKGKAGILIIVNMVLLSSCYHRELIYSFKQSSGGVMTGSSCYYLAQIREYRNPKGISRFPDGGQTKEIRQVFGLFKTDTISRKTVLAARLGDVYGWPVRYKMRLDKNDSDIAFGIVNINLPDSINGIYMFNIGSGRIRRYSDEGTLPALSKTSSLIAYCSNKVLSLENYSEKTSVARYPLDSTPVFINWENEDEIFLFYSDPFRVMPLDLKSGTVNSCDKKYIANYSQEIGASEISKMVEKTSPDLKKLLDNQ
jgi:hypothetical protein